MNGDNRRQEVLLRVGFVGAGKAGTAFGRYLAERIAEKDEKRIELAGYFSKNLDSTRCAAALTGSVAFETDITLAEASDIIFFSVPDGTIAAAFAGLTERAEKEGADMSGKLFAHLSGSLSSDVFIPEPCAPGQGAFSLHPACALSDGETAWKLLRETCFVFEGSDAVRARVAPLLELIGDRVGSIVPERKALYHAACVFLSNFSVALAAEGSALLDACGLDPETSSGLLETLFLGNAGNVAREGPTAALTGPAERGDAETVKENMAAISDFDDGAALRVYRDLTKILLRVAREKHPNRDYAAVLEAISD
jgi:predicted short-subunit dehydrogenase-like oxidoreductase (DUF2520 family)